MITYVNGNIFDSPAQVLVNPVNTVGVMGKGLALQFKRAYPEMHRRYRALCEQGRFGVGSLYLHKEATRWILCFPTKKHWRDPSRLEYIHVGLAQFRRIYAKEGIQSVAFPALGCGNGNLDFEMQVKPLMEHYLGDLPIDVYIYTR